MARILVAGAATGLAQNALLERLVAKVRDDGHDAVRYGAQAAPLAAMQESDAVIAVLDDADAATAAVIAFAHVLKKPCLGLHGPRPADPLLVQACTVRPGVDEADWFAALPAFYEQVRPFAGRLVRDLVPRLVKEAGHEVAFRELTADERPRFLKQKVLEEAQDLVEADLGDEKEEIADVLEALETLIRVREFRREDLKAVKDNKRKRRGGFDKGYVVEATASDTAPEDASTSQAPQGATTTAAATTAPQGTTTTAAATTAPPAATTAPAAADMPVQHDASPLEGAGRAAANEEAPREGPTARGAAPPVGAIAPTHAPHEGPTVHPSVQAHHPEAGHASRDDEATTATPPSERPALRPTFEL